jgi:predicted alpha/beta-fold hydrolase
MQTNRRKRIETPDGDFLDLDWGQSGHRRLAILTHGLEGHSRGHYCLGMARELIRNNWDVLAWNFRGCSGEPNLQLRSYHSGATEELQILLDHVFSSTDYESVSLIGFSLGGNLMLKYLGDAGSKVDSRIQASVAISVPCDLASSAKKLEQWQNRIYMARFMKTLRAKVREKAARFPGQLETDELDAMRTFAEFDETYTGPIHGFKGAEDYWAESSCRHVLERITVPTLLVNAVDDPFLTPACYPHEATHTNSRLTLETPRHGGHLGFVEFRNDGSYWSERRAVEFLEVRYQEAMSSQQ